MKGKQYFFIYAMAAIILIAVIVYYRKTFLSDKINEAIDNFMETNYNKNYIDTANQRFKDAVIKESFKPIAQSFLNKAIANKSIYESIAKAVNPFMSWKFVATLHARESNMNFNKHLHNGDPLTARTINVPANRPKAAPANNISYTFKESAIDALMMKGLNKWNDWSNAGMIYLFEKYNGWGYAYKNLPSPYVWSGTQFYNAGKYVKDGVFDPKAIDKQIGAATLLKHFNNNQI